MRRRNFLTGLAALPAAAMAGTQRDTPRSGRKTGRKFTDEEVDEVVEQAMGGTDRRRRNLAATKAAPTFRGVAIYWDPDTGHD